MMSERLYIIGNGFDRYHGAPSSYYDFRTYLTHHNVDIIKTFDLYFGPRSLGWTLAHPILIDWYFGDFPDFHLPVPKNEWSMKWLWSDFERCLSMLNREKLMDILDVKLPNLFEDDEDFNYGDYFITLDDISERVRLCSFEMRYQFHKWIKTLQYAKGYKRRMIELDQDALYLNFNYTEFLESVYGVAHENICYIHGSKRDKYGSLVLGHHLEEEREYEMWIHKNRNRKRNRPNLKGKNGKYFANDKLCYLAYFLDKPKKGNWRNPIRYYAVEGAMERFEGYYHDSYKDTETVILQHEGFFRNLAGIKEITVIGHSLSDVDMAYFEKIVASIADIGRVRWRFSVYSKRDEQNVKRLVKRLNLPVAENVQTFSLQPKS